MASANCGRLLTHWARRAASRAAWTAGNSRAIRTAMMAMTTSNSIKVNPRRLSRINPAPHDMVRRVGAVSRPGQEMVSESAGVDDFAAGLGPQCGIGAQVDTVLNELDRAVEERHVH